MTLPVPPIIDNFSNAIDGIYYRDLYAFATVLCGQENAFKTLRSTQQEILEKWEFRHWVLTMFSREHYIEHYSEFDFFGTAGQVSLFYEIIKNHLNYEGNQYLLVELKNVNSDNIVFKTLLNYISNLDTHDEYRHTTRFKSIFFLEQVGKKRFFPSYEYFIKNFTKKVDTIVEDMVFFFKDRIIDGKVKLSEKPEDLKYKLCITSNDFAFTQRIFIKFDCIFEYRTYINNSYCYIIKEAKIDEYSKKILNDFLIDLGFPYKKNFDEYLKFLENINIEQFMIVDKYVIREKDRRKYTNYFHPLARFFRMFIPSTINPKQFLNHTHIVGRSGSGKSELLKTIIKQVDKSCILIDPHGDIADSLDKKQGFFKIAPTESRFVINPFDITDKGIDNRELVTSEIIQLLQEIIQDSNVSVLMKTISFPIISTLLKLPYADFKMFADCINPTSGLEHLERLTPLVDNHLKNLWEDLKTDAYDTTKRSIFNRLQSFLNKHKIVNTVCGYDDFSEAIKRVEQGENLVVSLPIPQLGEEVSEVLGRFFMCRMQIWAKRRQALAEKDRKPVLLIVDECQNFLSEETASTLDQFGRKFGLYMVLAHQHISQIDGKGLKGSILANCKNKIVGYVDESTAKPMGGAMSVSYDEFTKLKKGHFWGLFEDKEPLKFYARLAKFKIVSETVNYATSQNTDFLDGWELVKEVTTTTNQTAPKTPKFTAKFDL